MPETKSLGVPIAAGLSVPTPGAIAEINGRAYRQGG
jgi:hypothetical protein